ncbi:hypothetical protein Pelo_13549 [Pelomyxa schiedti]|nr:hypothetical protein Pelo_13549 [Pelomyxa schiedti]
MATSSRQIRTTDSAVVGPRSVANSVAPEGTSAQDPVAANATRSTVAAGVASTDTSVDSPSYNTNASCISSNVSTCLSDKTSANGSCSVLNVPAEMTISSAEPTVSITTSASQESTVSSMGTHLPTPTEIPSALCPTGNHRMGELGITENSVESLRDIKNVLHWRVPNDVSPKQSPSRLSSRASSKSPLRRLPQSSDQQTPPFLRLPQEKLEVRHIDTPKTPITNSPPQEPSSIKPPSSYSQHFCHSFDSFNNALEDLYSVCLADLSITECTLVMDFMKSSFGDFEKMHSKLLVMLDPTPKKTVAWEESKHPQNTTDSTDYPSSSVSLLETFPPATITPRSAHSQKISPKYSQYGHCLHRRSLSQSSWAPPLRMSPPRIHSVLAAEKLPHGDLHTKMERADQIRKQFKDQRISKAEQVATRMKSIQERQSQKIAQQQLEIEEKLERADQLHESYLQEKKQKAKIECAKAQEVLWISSQQAENNKFLLKRQLTSRLEESEARKARIVQQRKIRATQRAEKAAAIRRRQVSQSVCSTNSEEPSVNSSRGRSPTPRSSPSSSPEMKPKSPDRPTKPVLSASLLSSLDGDTETPVLLTNSPFPAVLASLSKGDIDRIKDREKLLKKDANKLRQNLTMLALPYEDRFPQKDSPHKSRIMKLVTDLKNQSKMCHYSHMLTTMSAMRDMISKKGSHSDVDQHVMRQLNGLECLLKIIASCQEVKLKNRAEHSKIITVAMETLDLFCTLSYNLEYLMLSNKMTSVVNTLERTILCEREEPFVPPLMSLIAKCLRIPLVGAPIITSTVVGYILCTCIVDKLYYKLKLLEPLVAAKVTPPASTPENTLQQQTRVSSAYHFVVAGLDMLDAVVQCCHNAPPDIYDYLRQTLHYTSYIGIIPFLVNMLVSPHSATAEKQKLRVTHLGVQILNTCAQRDSRSLQEHLKSSDKQTELCHLLSILLTKSSGASCTFQKPVDPDDVPVDHVLFDTLLLMGYLSTPTPAPSDNAASPELKTESTASSVTPSLSSRSAPPLPPPISSASSTPAVNTVPAAHPNNVLLRWELSPLLDIFHWSSGVSKDRLLTLLHTICTLPFHFFSDPSYMSILFPTLATICFGNAENKLVMQQEVSSQLLVQFLQDQMQLTHPHTTTSASISAPVFPPLKSRWPPGLISDMLVYFSM